MEGKTNFSRRLQADPDPTFYDRSTPQSVKEISSASGVSSYISCHACYTHVSFLLPTATRSRLVCSFVSRLASLCLHFDGIFWVGSGRWNSVELILTFATVLRRQWFDDGWVTRRTSVSHWQSQRFFFGESGLTRSAVRESKTVKQKPKIITLRASCGAVYCNRSCLFVAGWVYVFVCLWICYHDNSKLRSSILTKLCL